MESGLAALVGAVGGLVGAVLVWLVAQHRIQAEHVTRERAKWRKKIRKKSLEVHEALTAARRSDQDLLRLQMQFRLLLSPLDDRDCEILRCITPTSCKEQRQVAQAKQFAYRVSLLLKHDWERAKLEAGFPVPGWFFRANPALRRDQRMAEKLKAEDCCPQCTDCKPEKSAKSKLRMEWDRFWEKYECRRLNTFLFLALGLLGVAVLVVFCASYASSATGDDQLARYDVDRNGVISCAEARQQGIAQVLPPLSIPSFNYQMTPKISLNTRCSISISENLSINGQTRSSDQLGIWSYNINP